MEPAIEWREHVGVTVLDGQLVVAAMEPAVRRRENVLCPASVRGVADTAMEPAVGRREHAAAGRGHAAGHLVTAMEPAAGRREHSVPALAPRMLLSPPQCSPPLNDGNTSSFTFSGSTTCR